MPAMSAATRRHEIIVGVLLLCLSIEALTLYPNFSVFVLAVPVGLYGLFRGMNALVA